MLLLKSHDGSEATPLPQDFFGAREVWFAYFPTEHLLYEA
eukprot:gene29635-1267_t